VAVAAYVGLAHSQTNQVPSTPPSHRALPDDNLGYPILITMRVGTGSGFYLNTGTAIYLVTAAHVLYDPDSGPDSGQLRDTTFDLLSYSGDPSDLSPNCVTVDTKRLEAGSIRRHPAMDVVAMKVFKFGETERYILPLPGVQLQEQARHGILSVGMVNVARFADVLVGNDVILFGYPTSLGLRPMPQIDLKRPLLRKGIVAGENRANHSIILDCPAYAGNSGGPVVEVDNENAFNRRYRIIGVVDQFVPYTPAGIPQGAVAANSGYSVIIPMDYVLELVQ